jgi:hypothetical protein
MQSRKVADNDPEGDAVAKHLDGLGTALIAMHDAEHSIKGDLLDQIVTIVRCRKTSEERVREIASLMRGRQVRNG